MGNVREVSSYSVTRGFFLVTKGFFLVTKGGDKPRHYELTWKTVGEGLVPSRNPSPDRSVQLQKVSFWLQKAGTSPATTN